MNRFGRIFRVELFGESHGKEIGAIIDGCPAGIPLSEEDFEADLARRRSGLAGTTPRRERDIPRILSGIYEGHSSGSPICVSFPNDDTRSKDYERFASVPRPGHADYTSQIKYGGFADPRGSGHFSGRITVGLVAAGVIAKKLLEPAVFGTKILSAGGRQDIEACIAEASSDGDSIGAVVETRVSGLNAGLGEPFFDACESLIAHAVFAVPGIRGVEFGDGFAAAAMRGSAHNDPFIDANGRTLRNGAGGINGGITNGNDLVIRTAVKPTSSIAAPQNTFDFERGRMTELVIEGRHDACIALRSAVVIEAAIAIALADLVLTAAANAPKKSEKDRRNI
ncbi:MAG TPA: chorismate synthase [Rectinemataceae bacterium]|nr:chorismate synthase [Rectinemataceae bacterium]